MWNAESQKSNCRVDLVDPTENYMMDVILARLLRGTFFMTEICTRLEAHAPSNAKQERRTPNPVED